VGFLIVLLGLWAPGRAGESVVSVEIFCVSAVLMGPAGLIAIGAMADHGDRRSPGGLWRDADEGRGIEPLCARTFDTLIVFMVMYVAVFGTGIRYMLMLVAKGPQPQGESSTRAEGQSGDRRVLYPRSPTHRSGDRVGRAAGGDSGDGHRSSRHLGRDH